MTNARKTGLGDLSFLVEEARLRSVCHRDTEVVRAIDCLVRDAHWGTLVESDIVETLGEGSWQKTFVAGGVMNGEMHVSIQGNTLTATMRLTARETVETCRAGFTVLHPINGVAGTLVTVTHADGTREESMFPLLISPSQPVFDIAGLDHVVGNSRVRLEFSGDVFEMEDQRNWTDASYKTYCRPLARPAPYTITKGQSVEQTIRLTVTDADRVPAAVTQDLRNKVGAVPEMLLAVEPDWAGTATAQLDLLEKVGNPAMLLRLDSDNPSTIRRSLDIIGGCELDLECVVPDDADPQQWLGSVATMLGSFGITPRHVFALPRAYMKSYQPDGAWPTGVSPDECYLAACNSFPDSRIGVGMLTNFTELNRCRPAPASGDYVTHSMTAIVHAADNRSVFETLESMPSIFATGADFTGNKPCRLGLVSIGMRTNPYADAVLPNPDGARIPMAGDDPRHRLPFGAAFAAGALIEASLGGVDAMALACLGGPFSLGDVDGPFPIFQIVKAARSWSARPVTAIDDLPVDVRGMRVGEDGGMIVNTSLETRELTLPLAGRWALLDPATTAAAKRNSDWPESMREVGETVALEPCAIALCMGGKST